MFFHPYTNKRATWHLIAFAFICSLLPVYAQKIEFERHSLQDGLSHSTVQCVFQDRQGFIWLGTQDGLNCWDGYSFTAYKHDPNDSTSISNSCVWSIYQDRKGRLWVGTLSGLNLFIPETKRFERYHGVPKELVSSSASYKNSMRTIAELSTGSLVIGTWGDGLRFFDPDTRSFQPRKENRLQLTSDEVFSIVTDRDGKLWVGTRNGLNLVDLKTSVSEHYQHDSRNKGSLSDNYLRSVYLDRQGQLWVGTGRGLDRFDSISKSFEHFIHDPSLSGSISDNTITTICQDRKGRLWVGTRDGLNLFDPKKKTFHIFRKHPAISTSVSDNYITALFETADSHLIVGTYGDGINVLNGRAKPFFTYSHDPDDPASLSSNFVWSIFKDSKDRLWVGTSSGLNYYNDNTDTFENYHQSSLQPHWFPDYAIMSISEDDRGRLWLGTAGRGLIILDLTQKTYKQYKHATDQPTSLPGDHVTSLYKDHNGRMWIGTNKGLAFFDPANQAFTSYLNNPGHPESTTQNFINSIYENGKGLLWLGENKGTSLFNPANGIFTNYHHDSKHNTSISSDFVMSALEDHQGRTWIATDHGLNLLDTVTHSFHTLHYGGLEYPGDYFYGPLEDNQGRLWSGTNKGLVRFTPATDFAPSSGHWGSIRNYTRNDGIQHDEFNIGAYHKGTDGYFYMGGINGFTFFHPDSIQDDFFIPPVFITGLEIFNKSILPGKNYNGFILPSSITNATELTLSHRESVFTIEFAALTYSVADKFQYAYQLQHFEKEWNYTRSGRRFATYTNLDPGTYVFRVKAANRDGVWSDQIRTLTIIITPPWWATWWFRLILVLCAFTAVGLLLSFRTKRIREANSLLTRTVAQKTKELNDKNEELMVQTALLEQKNLELERAKGQLEFELQYQHQRQLLKLSIDVQEDERKRIAQDLHDELGAVLSIARMHLVHMEGQHPKDVTLEGLQQARTLTENALITMRRISHQLMPTQLQKFGLIKTMEALAKQINQANKIKFELITPDEEPRWSKPAELGLYRVAMEMINNTIKHANASHIQIHINQSLEHIVVTYADNGTGLPQNYTKGLGLQNIDARINALGGSFEIVNETTSGFNARIVIPM